MGADGGKAQRQVTMKYQKKFFLSFKNAKRNMTVALAGNWSWWLQEGGKGRVKKGLEGKVAYFTWSMGIIWNIYILERILQLQCGEWIVREQA